MQKALRGPVQSFPYAQTCLNFCKKGSKALESKGFA